MRHIAKSPAATAIADGAGKSHHHDECPENSLPTDRTQPVVIGNRHFGWVFFEHYDRYDVVTRSGEALGKYNTFDAGVRALIFAANYAP